MCRSISASPSGSGGVATLHAKLADLNESKNNSSDNRHGAEDLSDVGQRL